MEKYITDKNGNTILNTLIFEDCISCIASKVKDGYAHISCPHDGVAKRLGFAIASNGQISICSSNSNTTKNFKILLNETLGTLSELCKTRNEVIAEVNNQSLERINRLVHNLKNINAHFLQELYNLIPQNLFMGKMSKMVSRVEKIVSENPKDTAYCLLRIARLNAGLKAEVAVYDKLFKENPTLNVRSYTLDSVLMLVLNEFFADFHANNVFVRVEDFPKKINLDFESFRVAMYHIFENATKYVLPNTKISIKFTDNSESNSVIIALEMTSFALRPNEVLRIFESGYSGEQAKANNKSGKGIGMYLAKQLLELMQATIEFVPGTQIVRKFNGIEYAENLILITLDKSLPCS